MYVLSFYALKREDRKNKNNIDGMNMQEYNQKHKISEYGSVK